MSSGKGVYGWGLIGPGRFAREFVEELRVVDRARLAAVASRNLDRAQSFADEWGFERAHGSYEALLDDEGVDIVYVVVPHPFHREVAEMAIDAGKPVLCEKPLTPSAEESRALARHAQEKGIFLMEGMKTGFLPAIRKVKEWIDAGRIGEVRLARADFCFRGPSDPEDRLMNPDLAGGAVLDVGIYPLYLARHLLGEVTDIGAIGSLASTGVEDSAAILTKHDSGASAALTCSFRTEEAMDAVLLGAEGEIVIPKFHAAVRAELRRDGEIVEVCDDDSGGMLRAEIEAAMDALDRGLLECPGHPLADAIRLAEIMDEVRQSLGAAGA